MNLLLNAAEATPEGGTYHRLRQQAHLSSRASKCASATPVAASRPTFWPTSLSRFFTTKRGQGTGLGLSISHAYVRSHGGDMRVDSVVDHGTTVTLTLPIRQEEANGEREGGVRNRG